MLGHQVTAYKNVDAIKTAVLPTDRTRMRSFLGAYNMYSRFNKNFYNIARTPNDYIQKDKELEWLVSTAEALVAFNTLKSRLVEPLVLHLL